MSFKNNCARNKRSHLTCGETGLKTVASCDLRFRIKEELKLQGCLKKFRYKTEESEL